MLVTALVLSGLTDEDVAFQAVQSGAQDYLVKGAVEGNLLARSLRYAVERHRILGELERVLVALEQDVFGQAQLARNPALQSGYMDTLRKLRLHR